MPDEQPPPKPSGMTAAEVTSLVNMFNGMLLAMEGRLSSKMDEHNKSSIDRWQKHDTDHLRMIEAWDSRFLELQKELNDHLIVANAHFRKEQDEDLVVSARVKPVKTLAGYVARNWKTILLIVLATMAAIGFSADILIDISRNLGFKF